MKQLLIILIAIKQLIKQYHWQAKTYQEHLLGDRLLEDLEDYIDEVAEISVVSEDSNSQLEAKYLLGKSSLYLENLGVKEITPIVLVAELVKLHKHVVELNDQTNEIGIKDICGRLSNLILRKIYLLQTQAK